MAKRSKDAGLSAPGLTDDAGDRGSPTPVESLGSAPSAKEAEEAIKRTKKAEAIAVETAKAPERKLTAVPLRVFAQLSGLKPDQFQPFGAYAVREEMRACTVPEWRGRLEAFQSKPTPKLKQRAR